MTSGGYSFRCIWQDSSQFCLWFWWITLTDSISLFWGNLILKSVQKEVFVRNTWIKHAFSIFSITYELYLKSNSSTQISRTLNSIAVLKNNLKSVVLIKKSFVSNLIKVISWLCFISCNTLRQNLNYVGSFL